MKKLQGLVNRVAISGAFTFCLGSLITFSLMSPAYAKDTLQQDERLSPGQSLTSNNGCFQLVMQNDGNLVLYGKGGKAFWATGTTGKEVEFAIMQGDGNFVLYAPGGRPTWATNPGNVGSAGFRLIVQDDGNAVVYANDRPIWAVNPGQRNCDGTAVVAFPITGDRDDKVANGRMRTSFTLSADGTLTAVTNTRTGVQLAGFTGGASIILLDGNKQPIWASSVHRYGVDGCMIGTCNRNDNWSDSVPSDILSQVKGYSILQQHEPKWLNLVGEKGEKFLGWLRSDEGKATISTILTVAAML